MVLCNGLDKHFLIRNKCKGSFRMECVMLCGFRCGGFRVEWQQFYFSIGIIYVFVCGCGQKGSYHKEIVCFHKKHEIAMRKRFYYAGLHLRSDAIKILLLGYLKDHFIVSFIMSTKWNTFASAFLEQFQPSIIFIYVGLSLIQMTAILS